VKGAKKDILAGSEIQNLYQTLNWHFLLLKVRYITYLYTLPWTYRC